MKINNRTYKEDTPEGTITKIRNLLNKLPLIPYELGWYTPYEGIYSVRITADKEDGFFGTNGKGRNRKYALASAYAEYIERLQNGYTMGTNSLNRFFLNELKKEYGFYYYPDERILTKEEFQQLPKDYLNDVFFNTPIEDRNADVDMFFSRLIKNGYKGVLSMPFYDCKNKTTVYLPYNLTLQMTGSNGMAAGNTSAEAIFQSLCELIERNVASTIYYSQLTPPTIPNDYLRQFKEEYKIIEDIESDGYQIIIKDFSCGKSFPAVGIIVIDPITNKYKLNVGVDTSFKSALSRCMTEVYQGCGDRESFNKTLLDIPIREHEYFLNNTKRDMYARSLEIRRFIINSSGVFPRTLFEEKESYSFNPEIFKTRSNYKEEVQYLIKLFLNLGDNVYIRDVSYLGFPSYYVYIPRVSLLGRKTSADDSNARSLSDVVRQDELEDIMFSSINELLKSKEKINQFINVMIPDRRDAFQGIKMQDFLRLEFENHDWAEYPVNYFLVLCCFVVGEYKNARQYLKSLMNETNNKNNKYYLEVLKYFDLLIKKSSKEEIEKQISKDLLDSFSSIVNIFKEIKDRPNCPDCTQCTLDKNCNTKGRLKLARKVAREMKSHELIDPNYLLEFCI